jgi:AraC-like DNA-binding protein
MRFNRLDRLSKNCTIRAPTGGAAMISPFPSPRGVRRAALYIDAHLDGPLTIGAVAAAAGLAGRTLHKHFQNRGLSPMRYVRERRFIEVRQALLNAAPDDSVTGIATRWGFSHLGRFAVEYRKRYGETPSQTLRRR